MSHAATYGSAQASKATSWSGRVLAGLVILFMIFDGVSHVLVPTPVVDAFAQLGFPLHLSVGLGILELVCVALFAIPRTSILGALLLTAYYGGAIATQVRAGSAWFPSIFPALMGALLWTSVVLRDVRVRTLLLVSPTKRG
jgi:hypothetical protein